MPDGNSKWIRSLNSIISWPLKALELKPDTIEHRNQLGVKCSFKLCNLVLLLYSPDNTNVNKDKFKSGYNLEIFSPEKKKGWYQKHWAQERSHLMSTVWSMKWLKSPSTHLTFPLRKMKLIKENKRNEMNERNASTIECWWLVIDQNFI